VHHHFKSGGLLSNEKNSRESGAAARATSARHAAAFEVLAAVWGRGIAAGPLAGDFNHLGLKDDAATAHHVCELARDRKAEPRSAP
jgi:hypothetical protein